jgi:predicted nucleic acid-binding protein
MASELVADIRQYVFSATDRLMLDTNIWLLIYGPQSPIDPRTALYSAALRRILEAQSRIYIDLVVIAEFINTYARMKQRLIAPRQSFKDFRRSADFQAVAQDIVADAKSLTKQCAWAASDLELAVVDSLLDTYELGQSDFNDQIIAASCAQQGLTLITDDSDFKDFHVAIITANQKLLM